jgi:hypothetical protein
LAFYLGVLGVLAFTFFFVGGCQTARVEQPLTTKLAAAADDADARMEFWHQLSDQPLTSNDDAFRALLLYFDGKDDAADYATRVERLRSLGMLPKDFSGPADGAVDRGTVAVAVAQGVGIKGGLTARMFGMSPRYAVRALQYQSLYPQETSPNQTFSGAEFVGIIGRIEDHQRGNPADKPAAQLPGEGANEGEPSETADQPGVAAASDAVEPRIFPPLFLTMQQSGAATPDPAADAPKATPENPADLKIVVTGVEGDVQVRADDKSKWEPAKVDMRLTGTAEFRTGARSAVRFKVPPDQIYTLDRLGSMKVARAVFNGKKVTTDVGLEKGRVRLDVVRGAAKESAAAPPADRDLSLQIEAAGVEYDSTIRSPNAALAVRGTQVSLYDQPPFAPEAVSLTGRAVFRNVRRQLIAFGGQAKAKVRSDQNSAAEQAFDVATLDQTSPITQNVFDLRQEALVVQRGGFVRGDVVVGDSSVSDAQLTDPASGLLPGALDFVLRWNGGPERKLADLNLAVVSPLSSASAPDFVANPPFTVSLAPGDPTAEALRAEKYPRTSSSGGRIGRNHVGPEGLEIASWPQTYPVGTYRVAVFDLVDRVAAPGEPTPPEVGRDPVTFNVAVFLNGEKLTQSRDISIGLLQTSDPILVRVPASATPTSSATPSLTKAAAKSAKAAAKASAKATRLNRGR